jgi:hypothetical protein
VIVDLPREWLRVQQQSRVAGQVGIAEARKLIEMKYHHFVLLAADQASIADNPRPVDRFQLGANLATSAWLSPA